MAVGLDNNQSWNHPDQVTANVIDALGEEAPRVDMVGAYVLNAAKFTHGHRVRQAVFAEEVSLRVVDTLAQVDAPDQAIIQLVEKINKEPTPPFPSELAERGFKLLGSDDSILRERGGKILSLAAAVTENIYARIAEASVGQRQEYLLGAYVPILRKQEVRDDKHRTQTTAQGLLPHLLKVAQEIGSHERHSRLDDALYETALAVGTLDSLTAVYSQLQDSELRVKIQTRAHAMLDEKFGEENVADTVILAELNDTPEAPPTPAA